MTGHGRPAPRFTIEKITLLNEREGPDYYSHGEFRVTDRETEQVVARFPWSLDEPYLTNAHYNGPDEVRITEDGAEAVATNGTEEWRVLLPVAWTEIEIDDVRFTPATDYAALARDVALHDGPPQRHTGFHEPGGQWLKKVFERLGRTREATALATAISALLSDPEPKARGEALRFYEFLPDAPGWDRILDLLRHRRDLFSVSDKGCWTGTTLDQDVTRVLGQRLRHGGVTRRVVRLARREALLPGAGREPLLNALVTCDGNWVRGHAIAIARVPERRWQDVLSAFASGDMDNLGGVAGEIVAAGIASRIDVLAHARAKFRGYALGAIENTVGGE